MMTDAPGSANGSRPRLSVVVPFFGDRDAAEATLAALSRLRRRPGDEVIVADNTPDGVVGGLAGTADVSVVEATGERSSYHARNVGAEQAGGEWLLFTDADCLPRPDLLDAFFEPPPAAATGILAGAVLPAPDGESLLVRWATSREILSQSRAFEGPKPAGVTACLLVRRRAWAELGGFLEGVRSGGDFEFCWRAADAGYEIEFRPEAVVEHRHRETLRGIARQMARYSAGNAWQERRFPGVAPRPGSARALARAVGGAIWFAVTLRPRRAALKLVDGVAAAAQAVGRGLGNSVPPPPESKGPAEGAIVVATDRFPVGSETFVTTEIAALRELGWRVRVEAIERPPRPALGAARGVGASYVEDGAAFGRLADTAWLIARHPLRSAADRLRRSRWPPEERLPLWAIAPQARRLARGGEGHVHVHFAAMAAVSSLRVGRLIGVPVSVAAHGHELFVTPRGIPEKIAAAAFVAAPCEYTARHLRDIAPSGCENRIETIVMGVDGSRFRRRAPYPGGRSVVAVGRLVEKKGFDHLIDAVARLDGERAVERLRIAGDGPLRAALEERIARVGLDGHAELLGALSPDEIRSLLERADVVAVPCVIASNGDRDAMPVVAKEALAMEVPVVATDEVGLPEVVEDGWGRLVPPGDAEALAAALAELLVLPADVRARMGAAGRSFVLERFDVRSQAERLAELVLATRGGSGRAPDRRPRGTPCRSP